MGGVSVSSKGKVLGVFALVMFNVIAIDSLRSLPFSASYGFSLVFYYLLASLLFFIPSGLVSAELATGWPNRGGLYVWVREAFGERWGFFIIWMQWIYNVVWYPTILVFLAGTLTQLIAPQLTHNVYFMLAIVVGFFWLATILNCFGMRVSSWVGENSALFGVLLPIFVVTGLGAFWMGTHQTSQIDYSWRAFFPHDVQVHDLVFLITILFSLIGIELSAVHADQVKDPGKAYPKAVFWSTIIIVGSLILSSLAIATVVPHNKLNVVTGLIQAFQLFLHHYRLDGVTYLMSALIIAGGLGSLSTWVLGPAKGLSVAAADGCLPAFFSKVNRHGTPVGILLVQALLLTVLCSVFFLMPTVKSSYWLLSVMTAQLALIQYIGLFAAAWWLRYKAPERARAYRIPFKNTGIAVVCLVGALTCLGAFALGFFPPSQIAVGGFLRYELILVLGISVLAGLPLIIYQENKPRSAASDA